MTPVDADRSAHYPVGMTLGRLYLVALPIGNLEDITVRAIRTLRSVDGILAEDTRVTRRVLDRYRIETPFFSSVFQGGERQRAGWLVDKLRAGHRLALVSDAGTPLISDPGYPLVREAIAAGIVVVPVPGPSATIAALIASGLPADRFCFEGTVPRKTGERRSLFGRLRTEERTTVLFESPHRLLDTLRQMDDQLPDRQVTIARELTKRHEEFLRGRPCELAERLGERDRVRGECVLVLAGCPPGEATVPDGVDEILRLLRASGVDNRTLVRVLVDGFNVARNTAYALVHDD